MNQKIAIIADNSVGYANALFEIWNEGNCAVLIDYKFPWEKIVELLVLANVQLCYVDKNVIDYIKSIR